jgi:hypothetical protein
MNRIVARVPACDSNRASQAGCSQPVSDVSDDRDRLVDEPNSNESRVAQIMGKTTSHGCGLKTEARTLTRVGRCG